MHYIQTRAHARLIGVLCLLYFAGACAQAPAVPDDDWLVPTVYRLGAGDQIRITVFGHDNLSGEFKVDGQGRVSLPLIQVVNAADRSTTELAQIIADRLQPDYLKNPRVSVDMIAFRPFYILGEVRNPGSYPYVEDMTVVTAVALAGGYTYRASRKKMVITRQDDPTKNKQRIDEDTQVMPGDIIEVPERYF